MCLCQQVGWLPCQQSLNVTPSVFIPLDHWSHCLRLLIQWRQGQVTYGSMQPTVALLNSLRTSHNWNDSKGGNIAHALTRAGGWQIPRRGMSTGLFLGVDVGAFDWYLQSGYKKKKKNRQGNNWRSHRCECKTYFTTYSFMSEWLWLFRFGLKLHWAEKCETFTCVFVLLSSC